MNMQSTELNKAQKLNQVKSIKKIIDSINMFSYFQPLFGQVYILNAIQKSRFFALVLGY